MTRLLKQLYDLLHVLFSQLPEHPANRSQHLHIFPPNAIALKLAHDRCQLLTDPLSGAANLLLLNFLVNKRLRNKKIRLLVRAPHRTGAPKQRQTREHGPLRTGISVFAHEHLFQFVSTTGLRLESGYRSKIRSRSPLIQIKSRLRGALQSGVNCVRQTRRFEEPEEVVSTMMHHARWRGGDLAIRKGFSERIAVPRGPKNPGTFDQLPRIPSRFKSKSS